MSYLLGSLLLSFVGVDVLGALLSFDPASILYIDSS